ncbi:MAG: hypothetical protein K9L68_07225 [Spirochaetales bacterium]|nr:hypothetical protein [Spirochaetales bacterium]MCF7938375.1 hypothetical protein [Spirochaetales bacterium]
MNNDATIEMLEIRWEQLRESAAAAAKGTDKENSGGSFPDPSKWEKTFKTLHSYYTQPHRHYHNLDHIAGSLRLFDEISGKAAAPFCVEAAIWFHDSIYQPGNPRNEEKSSALAERSLEKMGFPFEITEPIGVLIRLTSHVLLPKQIRTIQNLCEYPPDLEDALYLLDLDLGILGAEPPEYERYTEKIRKEYTEISRHSFVAGRKKLLKNLLTRERIYNTPWFFERFEAQARRNIQNELGILEQELTS